MHLSEKIDQAKTIAQEDWNKAMKKINCFNQNANRKWKEYKLDDGRLAFALEGTPDKAFVIVENDYTVIARRQDGSVIRRFK